MFGNFPSVCISLFNTAPSNNPNVSERGQLHLQDLEIFVEPDIDTASHKRSLLYPDKVGLFFWQ